MLRRSPFLVAYVRCGAHPGALPIEIDRRQSIADLAGKKAAKLVLGAARFLAAPHAGPQRDAGNTITSPDGM
jgi:hypothetical protein